MKPSDIDWSAVVAELSPGLLSYFAAVFPRQVARDLVQDVFLRLVTKTRTESFRPEKGTLRMYAYGIARYVRLEAYRKESVRTNLVDLDTIPSKESVAIDADAVHLRFAIQKLKPIEQDIILLLLDRDLRLEEIAALVSLPLGTVKSHVHRAKGDLRRILKSMDEEVR